MHKILAMTLLLCTALFAVESPKSYHFDEGSGTMTGGDAQIHGATWIEGFGAHALRFNPAQMGHVNIPGYGNHNQSEDIIRTLAGWVRTRSEGGGSLIEVRVLDFIELRYWQGKVTFAYTEWEEGPFVESDRTINDGKWHYVVGTGDGHGGATIYIDGEHAGSVNEPGRGNVVNAFGDIFVGGMLAGDMDEIFVSPHQMSQSEARERYENGDPSIRDAAALPASTWESTAVVRGAPRLLSPRRGAPATVDFRTGGLMIPLGAGGAAGIIYNAAGKIVRRLAPSGDVLQWDGSTDNGASAPCGTYILKLSTDGERSVHRLTVLGGK